jgi:hypothetical protein
MSTPEGVGKQALDTAELARPGYDCDYEANLIATLYTRPEHGGKK